MIERILPAELDIPRNAGDIPSGAVPTIEDARIREILVRLGVILHDQIAESSTFFRHGGGYDHRLAHPMDDEELAAWKSVYDMDAVVEDAIEKRSLFAVDIDGIKEALPESTDVGELVQPYVPEPIEQADTLGDTVRVNYGREAHWIPRELLTVVDSADDLTYLIKPEIHFGGQAGMSGHLYNAFVALDTYLQAGNGVQLVSKIPGTGIPGTPTSKPVYHPHTAISASLWMNTSIKEGEPNGISVNIDRSEQLMVSAAIHDIGALTELGVPESDKVRTWFWQLDRLISNQTLVLSPVSTPQIEAK